MPHPPFESVNLAVWNTISFYIWFCAFRSLRILSFHWNFRSASFFYLRLFDVSCLYWCQSCHIPGIRSVHCLSGGVSRIGGFLLNSLPVAFVVQPIMVTPLHSTGSRPVIVSLIAVVHSRTKVMQTRFIDLEFQACFLWAICSKSSILQSVFQVFPPREVTTCRCRWPF